MKKEYPLNRYLLMHSKELCYEMTVSRADSITEHCCQVDMAAEVSAVLNTTHFKLLHCNSTIHITV